MRGVLTAVSFLSLAVLATACGGGGDGRPDDGAVVVQPGGGSVAPDTFLHFEGARYRLIALVQANLVRGDEFKVAGMATEVDIDYSGKLAVYRRAGDSMAVYTLSPAREVGGESAVPALWLRWLADEGQAQGPAGKPASGGSAVGSGGPHPGPDASPGPGGARLTEAPIESAVVIARATSPEQYALRVRAGLPDGCTRQATHQVTRGAAPELVRVRVLNARSDTAVCTQVYGSYELTLDLGGDFRKGMTYRIEVNSLVFSFTP